MYKKPYFTQNTINLNQSTEGEMLETKIDRIVLNKEPIKDGAPILYTDRKEGVRAGTNIRTDRWEIAIEATDKIARSFKAKREERAKAPKNSEAEPIQGKDETPTNGNPKTA